MIAKDLIRERFSAAAQTYERYAFIQQQTGRRLFDYLAGGERDYAFIADVGAGTAALARLLSARYPQAKVFALDIALGMLIKARQAPVPRLIQADAEFLPFGNKTLDLIVSNLAYQWVANLEKALVEARDALKNNGRFYFSVFGDGTLYELKECLRGLSANEAFFGVYPDSAKIHKLLLSAGFSGIEISAEKTKEFFPDFFALIRWLKLIGANYAGVKFAGLSARGALEKIGEAYAKNFPYRGGICVSFNRIIVGAAKK